MHNFFPSAQASAPPLLHEYHTLSPHTYVSQTQRTRPEHASNLPAGIDPISYSNPVYPSHLYPGSSHILPTSRPWESAPPVAPQPLPSDHAANIPPTPPASPPPAVSFPPAAPPHSEVQDAGDFTIPIYTRNHRLFGFARQRQQQEKPSTTGTYFFSR